MLMVRKMRLIGKHFAVLASSLIIAAAASHAQAAEVTLQKVGEGAAQRLVIENPYLKVVINPLQGARIESLVHKSTGKDLVAKPAEGVPWGLMSDQLWQQDFWHSDWNRAEYKVVPMTQGPQQVKVWFYGAGTLWKGVTIKKALTVDADRCALDFEYEVSGAGSPANARGDLWIHNGLIPGGKVFMPAEQGVLVRPRSVESENWTFDATRGWIATVYEGGAGLVAAMDYSHIRALRSEHRGVTSMEWILRKADMKPGAKLATNAVIAPVADMPTVAGVCREFAVALETPDPTGGKLTAKVVIAPLQNAEVDLAFELVRLSDGQSAKVSDKHMTLKVDKRESFDLPVTIPADGSFVLKGIASIGGKPALQFEKLIVSGKPSGAYAMAPQGPRVGEFPDFPTKSRFHPIDMNFNSTAVITPHRVWAKPYAGGRPKVLVLVVGHDARAAVELAQRFDIDLTVPFLCPSTFYALGDLYLGLKMNDVQSAAESLILGKKYDVIIMDNGIFQGTLQDNPKLPIIPQKAKDYIIKLIKEDGAGLILLQRGAAGPVLEEGVPLVHLGYDWAGGPWVYKKGVNHVIDALPYDVMPPTYDQNGSKLRDKEKGVAGPEGDQVLMICKEQPIMATTTWGKGRLAQVIWNSSLIPNMPTVCGRDMHEPPQYDYWEYWYAMLGRFIYWGARMESGVDLRDIVCSKDAAKITMGVKEDAQATLKITFRDEFGKVLGRAEQKADLKKLITTIDVPVPAEVGASYCLADVSVENEKGVLAFGAGSLKRTGAQIRTVTADKPVYDLGAEAKLDVAIAPAAPEGAVLNADIMDGSARVAARVSMPAAGDKVTLTAPLARVIGPMFVAHLTLRNADGTILDQNFYSGKIHTDLAASRARFQTFHWGGGMGANPSIVQNWLDLYLDTGITANSVGGGDFALGWREMDRINMPYITGTVGMAAAGVTKADMEKRADEKGPFSSQDVWKGQKDAAVRTAKTLKDYNMLMYQMGDENRVNTKDVDFSKAGLALFRKWLQDTQYKDIAALNAEWKTQFKSFDEVMPMTEAEIKDFGPKNGSYAAWADQRECDNWAYAEMARAAVSGFLEVDKTSRAGASGTQQGGVYSGQDYWRLHNAYNALLAYGGDQENQQTSYEPADYLRYTWVGYGKPNPILRTSAWTRLGTIDRGLAVFHWASHMDPDMTLPECGRDLKQMFLEMTNGTGQLLVEAAPVNSGVYVLQSSTSLSGSYILGTEPVSTEARTALMDITNDIGIVHRHISWEQLRNGELEKLPVKVLILPDSAALSKAECDSVRKWVNAGGTVIADIGPAIMTEHCRVLEKGQLDDVFGIDRAGVSLKKGKWMVSGPDNVAMGAQYVEVGLKGQAKSAWTAKLEQETAPVAFMNAFGKGKAYYFGFDAFGAYSDARGKSQSAAGYPVTQMFLNYFDGIIKQAGVTQTVRPMLLDEKGQVKGWLNFWNNCPKVSGNQRYIIFTRDQGVTEAAIGDVSAQLQFEKPAYLYDVLAGRELGYGDKLPMTSINDNTVRVIAALPYRVTGVKVDGPADATAGSDIKLSLSVIAEGGAPEMHVFHVDAIQPDGKLNRTYTQNCVSKNGKTEFTAPFGLDDPAGAWTFAVRDAATGANATKTVKLTAAK